MILLKDFYGKEVRLTDERLSHILRHSEMIGQEKFIAETLSRPDSIIISHHDSKVCLYHKLFDKTPVTRKYLVVAVKYIEDDAFVITSFFTSKEKKGTINMDSVISVWYDKEGDFLEIIFKDAKGYFQEISDDIYERVDENGNLLGYAVFNMTHHERQSLSIPLKTHQLQSLIKEI